MQLFHWFSFLNFPLVQFSPSPILDSISTFQTFMHGNLCVVTFLHSESKDANFPLIQFSELSIGSLFPITHPRFHFCMDIYVWWPFCTQNPEVQIFHWFSFPNFPLVQFSLSPTLGSISTFKTFMHGHLCVMTFLHLESKDANFLLIQFSELSFGLVFPITHPRFRFNI